MPVVSMPSGVAHAYLLGEGGCVGLGVVGSDPEEEDVVVGACRRVESGHLCHTGATPTGPEVQDHGSPVVLQVTIEAESVAVEESGSERWRRCPDHGTGGFGRLGRRPGQSPAEQHPTPDHEADDAEDHHGEQTAAFGEGTDF